MNLCFPSRRLTPHPPRQLARPTFRHRTWRVEISQKNWCPRKHGQGLGGGGVGGPTPYPLPPPGFQGSRSALPVAKKRRQRGGALQEGGGLVRVEGQQHQAEASASPRRGGSGRLGAGDCRAAQGKWVGLPQPTVWSSIMGANLFGASTGNRPKKAPTEKNQNFSVLGRFRPLFPIGGGLQF